MATVSDHKSLDCPLCFKTFITPRVLPCSHTFCEKCLGAHIESQKDGSEFKCPLCASPSVRPNPNLAVDLWASTFPLNTLICSVLEAGDLSEENDDNCEPCKNGGQSNHVEVWCVDCQEKLCSSCFEYHKRMKQSKHHSTVPIDKIKQHAQPLINFDLECAQHRDKIKLFCVDHRELCCSLCVATDHRQCNDVRSIDDIARDQSQRSTSDYPSIIRDIRNMKTEMEKILLSKKSNLTQVQNEKEQIIHDMDVKIDRIIEHLNKLNSAFQKETDQLYKDTESSILTNEKNVQGFITNVENSMAILQVAEKGGTPQQKFATFENTRSQIATHYRHLKSELRDEVEVHFTMKISQALSNIEGSLTSLESVDVTSQPSTVSRDVMHGIDKIIKNLNSRTKIGSEMCAAQVKKHDMMTSPLTFAKVVTRSELGSGTRFTGGTYLPDGRLVMADLNNKRLVQLDDDYNMVKEYEIDRRLTDVSAGNKDNEIYITVDYRYIYKCTLHTDQTVVSRMKAPSGTCGIALSNDNIIVGTDNAVVILTLDGSKVRSIPKSGYSSYVAVSLRQRTIYHSNNNDVVCRTWEGQEVFRYRHIQLWKARGIHVDNNDNVYVCGMNSHNVHQISKDGQRSRIIQLQNIKKPYFVLIHRQKRELLVTSLDEDAVCEIYKLR